MFDSTIADQLNAALAAALADAVSALSTGTVEISTLREKDLSSALACSLRHYVDGVVVERRSIKLEHFPRVGGADITGYGDGGDLVFLAELKWSYSIPDKIFEAAWDAVKLALAREQFGLDAAWLVTGAPVAAWAATECGDLFTDGEVSVRTLWDRQIEPRGPNYGSTVGDDCEIGGRGLMFSATPETLRIRTVAKAPIVLGADAWELRAADVQGVGATTPFLRRLDPAQLTTPTPLHVAGADFPKRISQRWLERNVPHLYEDEFARLIKRRTSRIGRRLTCKPAYTRFGNRDRLDRCACSSCSYECC